MVLKGYSGHRHSSPVACDVGVTVGRCAVLFLDSCEVEVSPSTILACPMDTGGVGKCLRFRGRSWILNSFGVCARGSGEKVREAIADAEVQGKREVHVVLRTILG